MQEDAYWDQHAQPKVRAGGAAHACFGLGRQGGAQPTRFLPPCQAKRDAKREEQERQREEVAKKKAEAKRLAAEEEAALAAAGKKKAAKPAAPKVGWRPPMAGVHTQAMPSCCCTLHAPCLQVTAHQLAGMREREQREMQQMAEQQRADSKRIVSEDAYAAAIEVENRNRCAA